MSRTEMPLPPLPLPRFVRSNQPNVLAVEYGADSRLAAQARRWVWTASRLHRLQAEPLVWIANELFANSLRHTRSGLLGGKTRLTLTHLPNHLRIAATDEGPLPDSVPGEPYLSAETEAAPLGLGLTLVSALATAWGWHGDQHGHTVWAEVARPKPGKPIIQFMPAVTRHAATARLEAVAGER
ncbi:ATP-binding protein [Nocardiopsis sp. Huas11]|uniref:ATP-binding protein n=1 Tax=Nocardiopsis sp. Huas11 TaxID=2183912 RepID=UPI000EB43A38|nr:ATP-binding protein [Nocardiopsis sp. Huas11]